LFEDLEFIQTSTSVLAVVISFWALWNGRKSRRISDRSLAIAENNKINAEVEYLKTTPAIDIIDVVNVEGTYRAVLLLSNMREAPFRINSLTLYRKAFKQRSISNFIRSKVDPDFDWDYEQVEGYAWNPKGDLDDREKFVNEAGQFLVVKEQEKILVTIPDFNQYATYRFKINTTHGVITIADSITPNGNVYFCKEFKQSFH
jgi:hypothetical protein